MLAAIAALALAAPPALAPDAPDLSWLAGYWLSCGNGREVSETWSDPRGGILMGYAITTGAGGSSWEQMRIESGVPGPGDTGFVAQPRGAAAPVAFRLVRSRPREAVFENPAHDFPQRVIYRREGNRLTGRIEGAGGRSMEWRYRSAPLNARCPRRR